MATQRYGRTQNQVLLAKVEAVEGTAETLVSATDAMPIEPFSLDLGEQTIDSNEATGSIIQGETVVTRFDSRVTAAVKMRGSGNVATAPRQGPVLRAGGTEQQILTVLPSSTTFACTGASTTTTIVVDRTAGTGTQLAATNALLAVQLVGRVMTLAVNPATPRDVVIVKATVTSTLVTITFGETLVAAADATTTAVVKAGILYQPSTAPPSLTLAGYRDGKLISLVGARPKLSFAMPGSERPTLHADFGATFVSETDVAVPSDADFSGLPSEPIWRNGRAWLDYLETAASDFSLDFQTSDTRFINPNLTYGVDRNILTKQNPGGSLTINDKLIAYHNLISKIAANTKMPFVAVTDLTGAAGSRWAVAVPNLKVLKRGEGDREGLITNALSYQAVFVSPTPVFTFFNY